MNEASIKPAQNRRGRKAETGLRPERRITVAPNGKGMTKGDELMRRLRFEFGYDPLTELVALAKSKKTSTGEKIKIATEIMSFYQPKVKSLELNPNQGEMIKLNISFPSEDPVVGLLGLKNHTETSECTDPEKENEEYL